MAISALMLAAVIASLAGVLLEKLFQHKDTDLWIANFQLSTFSIAPAAFLLFIECGQSEHVLDPFRTFTTSYWPWVTVLIQGAAGVLVALTTKYAGCIAGSIAGIASIALTHLIELARGDNPNSTGESSFFVGFALVAAGLACYSYYSTIAPLTIKEKDIGQGKEQYKHTEKPRIIISSVAEKGHPLVDSPYTDSTYSLSSSPDTFPLPTEEINPYNVFEHSHSELKTQLRSI